MPTENPRKRYKISEVIASVLDDSSSDEDILDSSYDDSSLESESDSETESVADSLPEISADENIENQTARTCKVTANGDVNVVPIEKNKFVPKNTGPKDLPNNISAESSEYDFMSIFWDDDLWNMLVECTNITAQQRKVENPNYYYGKIWNDVTVEELKAFFGLRITMEMLVYKSRYEKYWNQQSEKWLTHTPGFAEVMPKHRFLAIWSFLHAVDEEDENIDKSDKIYKVRPILNHLLQQFQKYYVPEEEMALDEGMIPTKNRLAIKQYLKDKPVKWGIKSFILCESKTGYIWNAEVYTGKVTGSQIEKLGATGNVVIRLTEKLQGLGYCIYMDRFYWSISVA
jgi:hypothetical protein